MLQTQTTENSPSPTIDRWSKVIMMPAIPVTYTVGLVKVRYLRLRKSVCKFAKVRRTNSSRLHAVTRMQEKFRETRAPPRTPPRNLYSAPRTP